MVALSSPFVPADYLALYQHVVHQAIDVFTAIIELYQPDIKSSGDWADITVSEATGQRRELQQRLLTTKVKEVNMMTFTSTIMHYLDTHWGDYERVLTPDPIKRQQVEQFHATLEGLTKELSPVMLALWQQERE